MFIILWQLGHKLQNMFYESEALHSYHGEKQYIITIDFKAKQNGNWKHGPRVGV